MLTNGIVILLLVVWEMSGLFVAKCWTSFLWAEKATFMWLLPDFCLFEHRIQNYKSAMSHLQCFTDLLLSIPASYRLHLRNVHITVLSNILNQSEKRGNKLHYGFLTGCCEKTKAWWFGPATHQGELLLWFKWTKET